MEPKDKRKVVEEMLSEGDTMLCLDSRYPDVHVPDNHKGKEDLRLVLNLNFRHSIATMPDGIQAELLFGGVPYLCWIPYESIWAVYDPQTGEGHLWPGDTPLSLGGLSGGRLGREEEGRAKESSDRSRKSGLSEDEKDARTGRPRFRVIEGGKKS